MPPSWSTSIARRHRAKAGVASIYSSRGHLHDGAWGPSWWRDPIWRIDRLHIWKGSIMTHLASIRIKDIALITLLVPLAVTGAAGTSSTAASSMSTGAAPPIVELLSRGTVARPFRAKANGIRLQAKRRIDVATAHLTFQPGDSTGWHKHPGPTVVTITTGQLTLTGRRCRSRTFEAGDTFVEKGPRRHMAVNTGETTTETIVTFFMPEGAEALAIPATPPRCAR